MVVGIAFAYYAFVSPMDQPHYLRENDRRPGVMSKGDVTGLDSSATVHTRELQLAHPQDSSSDTASPPLVHSAALPARH